MSKKFDIGEAEFRLGEVKPLQMVEGKVCTWLVNSEGYYESSCRSAGWFDPTDYDDFVYCPFCGEEILVIREDEEGDDE